MLSVKELDMKLFIDTANTDEIKKANIEAMKNKDANLRSIYSVVINKFMQAHKWGFII